MSYDWPNDPKNPDALPPWPFIGGWALADWVTWHKASLAKYGKYTSDEYFVGEWWDVSGRRPWYATAPFNQLMTDLDSAAYLKASGLWDRLFRGLSIGGVDVLPSLSGVPKTFAETGLGTTKALDKTLSPTALLLKYLPIALPFILVGIVLYKIWPYISPGLGRALAARDDGETNAFAKPRRKRKAA